MNDQIFCYGAACTWFGSINETGKRVHIPCCPNCSGVLFEMPGEREWWDGVDSYERDGHPGYRAMLEWQHSEKKCFRLLTDLTAAHRASVNSESARYNF